MYKRQVENLGGKASVGQLYEILAKHPKAKDNNNVREKIRQILGSFNQEFVRISEGEFKLRALSSKCIGNVIVPSAI